MTHHQSSIKTKQARCAGTSLSVWWLRVGIGRPRGLGMFGLSARWNNACLTHAMALCPAQYLGRCRDTLFSEEGDGALYPERKRAVMAMKREVLRMGGYQRDVFRNPP